MSTQLSQTLIPAVWEELKSATSSSPQTTSTTISTTTSDDVKTSLLSAQVAEAVKADFTKLDKQIVDTAAALLKSDKPFSEVFAGLKVASVGSCALYNPLAQLLHVAYVGDSRAVLGTQSPESGD